MITQPVRHRLVKHVSMVCMGILFALVLLEGILRIVGLRHATAPMRSHTTLHHVHERSCRFVFFEVRGDIDSHPAWFDDRGFVTAPDAPASMRWDENAVVRILFMGDSFTEAVQVPFADSFVGRLAARASPGTCLANAGVASYSPVLYRLQWRQTLRDMEPTHVVLQLFGNDVRDDVSYAADASSLDILGLPQAVPGPPDRWYTTLWRASYLGYELRRISRIHSYKRKRSRLGPTVNVGEVVEEHPEITPLTHRALLALREEISAAGAELWIMPVTSRKRGLAGATSFGHHVRAWCETNGVKVVDLRSDFVDPGTWFFPHDIHWNAAGHAWVADSLAEVLPGFSAPQPLPGP